MAEENLFSKKNILLLLLMIVILGAFTGFGIRFMLSENKSRSITEQKDSSELILLSPLEITLLKNNPAAKAVYGKLKIQLALQIKNKETKEHVFAFSAQYLDRANELLSGKNIDAFQDQNPGRLVEKQLKLKQELLGVLNELSPAKDIEAIFFNEFFITENE